jgi:hypothetical protein
MRHTVPTPRSFASKRPIVLALLLGSAACDVPNFEGPQIQTSAAGLLHPERGIPAAAHVP